MCEEPSHRQFSHTERAAASCDLREQYRHDAVEGSQRPGMFKRLGALAPLKRKRTTG